jgi:hypothetical protein
MIEQLKLLLDAARWRARNEFADVDYNAYKASERIIKGLESALYAAEEFAELTKGRPANYDPHAGDEA